MLSVSDDLQPLVRRFGCRGWFCSLIVEHFARLLTLMMHLLLVSSGNKTALPYHRGDNSSNIRLLHFALHGMTNVKARAVIATDQLYSRALVKYFRHSFFILLAKLLMSLLLPLNSLSIQGRVD